MSIWSAASRDSPIDESFSSRSWYSARSALLDIYWTGRPGEIEQRRITRHGMIVVDKGKDIVTVWVGNQGLERAEEEFNRVIQDAKAKRLEEEDKALRKFVKAMEEVATEKLTIDDARALDALESERDLVSAEYHKKMALARFHYSMIVEPAGVRYQRARFLVDLPSILDPPAEQYLIHRKDEDKWLLVDDPIEARLAVEEALADTHKLEREITSALERQHAAANKGAVVARFDPAKKFLGRRQVWVRSHRRNLY